MCVLTMLKISENNGTEEIGLVTPTPGLVSGNQIWVHSRNLITFKNPIHDYGELEILVHQNI